MFRIYFSYETHFRFMEMVAVCCFVLTLTKFFRSLGLWFPFQGGFLYVGRLAVLSVFVYFISSYRTIGQDFKKGRERFLLEPPKIFLPFGPITLSWKSSLSEPRN
jgi:hypothetical protein